MLFYCECKQNTPVYYIAGIHVHDPHMTPTILKGKVINPDPDYHGWVYVVFDEESRQLTNIRDGMYHPSLLYRTADEAIYAFNEMMSKHFKETTPELKEESPREEGMYRPPQTEGEPILKPGDVVYVVDLVDPFDGGPHFELKRGICKMLMDDFFAHIEWTHPIDLCTKKGCYLPDDRLICSLATTPKAAIEHEIKKHKMRLYEAALLMHKQLAQHRGGNG